MKWRIRRRRWGGSKRGRHGFIWTVTQFVSGREVGYDFDSFEDARQWFRNYLWVRNYLKNNSGTSLPPLVL